MKKVLLTKKILLLCLLLWVALTSGAENYSSSSLANNNYGRGDLIKNSSGDDVRYISAFNKRIAITGGFWSGEWTWRNKDQYGRDIDPVIQVNEHSQTLSIMNLFQGDKVKINSWGSNTPSLKSNNASQSDGYWIMSSTGSMDFTIRTGTFIISIEVLPTNTSNRIAFDLSGQESGGYFRCRLSSRSFDEPALSVYSSDATVTYTVETYDKMNGTKLNDASHEVATPNNKNYGNYYKLGDILFKNLGWCKVTATANGQSASYWVECWDNEAFGELQSDGITYKLVQTRDTLGNLLPSDQQGGVLKERVVTAVGGITMKFGIPNDNSEPNTTVVYPRDGHMVSYTSANDGWWDRVPHNNWSWPEQGTFYSFEATAKGKLRFGGIKDLSNGNLGKVYLVKIDPGNGFPQVRVFDEGLSGYVTTTDNGTKTNNYTYNTNDTDYTESIDVTKGIDMEPGWIYYLQGEANSESNPTKWSPFLLEWFSYETELKLSAEWGVSAQTGYEIGNNGSVTTRETITGASNATCTVDCKGNIQSASASIDGSGHIVFSNIMFKSTGKDEMGGAMKVTINVGTSHRTFYMTIPYGQHIWDFRRTADQATEHGDFSYDEVGLINMMKANTSDWTRVYKVASKVNGVWNEMKSPIMAARSAVQGNNAFYMDNTTGLAFTTDNTAKFGAGETINNADGFSNMNQDQQYNLNWETTEGGNLVWIKGGTTIYFPGVKAGQYIKLHTYRHSDNLGENFKAKNLTDLDGNNYDPNYEFKLRGIWDYRIVGCSGDNMRGCAIFRVTQDATNDITQIPSLTLSDNGWAQIYRIEISDEYKPELFLSTEPSTGYGNVYVDEDGINGSIVVRNGQSVKREYLATSGNTGSQNANTCDYEVILDEGVNVTVERTKWNSKNDPTGKTGVDYNMLTLTYKGGKGLVKIIQRERANNAGTNVTNEDPAVNSGNFAFGYVIDKREYNIAVGELTEQTYPYTWDFNNYNMYQGQSTTDTDLAAAATANAGMWSSNNSTFSQVTTTTYKMGDNSSRNPEQEYTITKPLFAQGAQLVAGNKTIIETEGLGIQLPYSAEDKVFTWPTSTGAPAGQSVMGQRPYKAFDMTKKFAINGNNLTGCGQITIPNVDKGMYVFVKATAAPSVKIGGNAMQAISEFEPASGVYVYKNTSAKADVVLDFASEVSIDKIGVTNIEKSINALGYATESRNHAIDHTYTGIFTTNDVNAYGVVAYGEGDTKYDYTGYPVVNKTEKEVTVVPANTGVVLYKASNSARFTAPLFYPACNIVPTEEDLATLATNWMAPNVEATLHDSETESKGGVDCTKFIMTTTYFTYNKTTETTSDDKPSTIEAFYRMRIDKNEATAAEHNTIGANKAYLLVPTANLPIALWNGGDGKGNAGYANTFIFDIKDVIGDVDGIEGIIAGQTEDNMEQQLFYTIDGRRINGTPKAKGIYICNGKKVLVK